MRLIDADKLKECAIACNIHNGTLTDLCVPLYQIDNAPTEDVIPNKEGYEMYNKGYMSGYERGKEERPHGEWIIRWTGNEEIAYCTNCKNEFDPDSLYLGGNEYPKFCPECGADMRKEADNEND